MYTQTRLIRVDKFKGFDVDTGEEIVLQPPLHWFYVANGTYYCQLEPTPQKMYKILRLIRKDLKTK